MHSNGGVWRTDNAGQNSVHGDIHTIVFAPGDGNKLWVGCDGGVFSSANPTGSGDVFRARNTGLATLTMNYLGQHPTEDVHRWARHQLPARTTTT